MSEQGKSFQSETKFRASLRDPEAYVILPGVTTSRQAILDQFLTGFPKFLIQQAQTSTHARELLSALNRLPDGHLASVVSNSSEIDWTDEAELSDAEKILGTLNDLYHVLNDPSANSKRAAKISSPDTSIDDLTKYAPLAVYTKWLFQDKRLGVLHGYLWEQYIEGDLAGMYVRDKEAPIPKEVVSLLDYVEGVYKTAMQHAFKGVDNRQVGVGQILGEMVGKLGALESEDARFDYTVRLDIARKVTEAVKQKDKEALLQALLTYIKPADIECAEVQGAVFKPVVITDPNGKNRFSEMQRFDSFWFRPPFENGGTEDDLSVDMFPDNPQVISNYFDYDLGDALDKRVTHYKDLSYFRPDGSKVYWGDLSSNDVKIIRGNYYCVSQSESFHKVPEWAVRMASFIDNEDSNRPVESFINTTEGQVALPENPLLVDPDYVKAVAIGAIKNGSFIENKRACAIKMTVVKST